MLWQLRTAVVVYRWVNPDELFSEESWRKNFYKLSLLNLRYEVAKLKFLF